MKGILAFAAEILVAAVCLLTTHHALSEDISIRYTAIVESVDDAGGFLGGNVNEGMLVTGTYRYDSDAEDVYSGPYEDYWGEYYWFAPPYGIDAQVGAYFFESIASEDMEILGAHIKNDWTEVIAQDVIIIGSKGKVALNGEPMDCIYHDFDLVFLDPTMQAINSDELPLEPPNLALWDQTYLSILCDWGGSLNLKATILSMEVVPVSLMEQLAGAIDQLVGDGFISDRQAGGLRTKLLRASVKFAGDVGADKTVQACNQMEAFINQVNGLDRKFIPEQDAALLLGLADEVMIEEGCLQ